MPGKTGRRNADFTGSDEDLNLNPPPPPSQIMPISNNLPGGENLLRGMVMRAEPLHYFTLQGRGSEHLI